MRARNAFLWAVPAALFALAGCGGRGVIPESQFDQAQTHVDETCHEAGEVVDGRLAQAVEGHVAQAL